MGSRAADGHRDGLLKRIKAGDDGSPSAPPNFHLARAQGAVESSRRTVSQINMVCQHAAAQDSGYVRDGAGQRETGSLRHLVQAIAGSRVLVRQHGPRPGQVPQVAMRTRRHEAGPHQTAGWHVRDPPCFESGNGPAERANQSSHRLSATVLFPRPKFSNNTLF